MTERMSEGGGVISFQTAAAEINWQTSTAAAVDGRGGAVPASFETEQHGGGYRSLREVLLFVGSVRQSRPVDETR